MALRHNLTETPKDKINVLFVCLGNICRSPMAHAVFLDHISKLPPSQRSRFGTIDSAGTGAYHILDPPDPRTMSTLDSHGIHTFSHGARKVQPADFDQFDYVFGMDAWNVEDLRVLQNRHNARKQRSRAQVSLFGKFGGEVEKGNRTRNKKGKVDRQAWEGEEVIDPYYGGDEGFEIVFEQVDRFSKAFLEEVLGDDQNQQDGGQVEEKIDGAAASAS